MEGMVDKVEIPAGFGSAVEAVVPELLPGECTNIEGATEAWKNLQSEFRPAFKIVEVGTPTGLSRSRQALVPPDFEWPICRECGSELVLKHQIHRQDAPGLPAPAGKDLFLAFLCPEDCGEEEPEHFLTFLDSRSELRPATEGPHAEPIGLQFEPFRDHPGISELQPIAGTDWIAVGLADCELLENGKPVPFLDGIDQHHLNSEKTGGYVSWVQWAWRCCSSALMPVTQIEWAEGYWYVMACPDCGKLHTEYQGT